MAAVRRQRASRPGIGLVGNGTNCFTHTTIQALSLGMTYDF
jgi:hypothetical protein